MTLYEKLAQHQNNYPSVALGEIKIPEKLKTSFIIPTYNSEKTLKVVLETIASQTEIRHINEVVIVDDLSEDGTGNMIQSVEDNYPTKIVYIRNKEKLFAGQSRNVGIAYATGDIVFFLDSDIAIPDNYLSDHLKIHIEF